MSATAMNLEQRRFSRIPLARTGTLELFDHRAPCELVDISLRGARLRVAAEVVADEGQVCTVTIDLDEGPAKIRMHGLVAYRTGPLLAVQWHKIDLDSLAHLRRMLELNLGDDGMVRAELMRLASAAQAPT